MLVTIFLWPFFWLYLVHVHILYFKKEMVLKGFVNLEMSPALMSVHWYTWLKELVWCLVFEYSLFTYMNSVFWRTGVPPFHLVERKDNNFVFQLLWLIKRKLWNPLHLNILLLCLTINNSYNLQSAFSIKNLIWLLLLKIFTWTHFGLIASSGVSSRRS